MTRTARSRAALLAVIVLLAPFGAIADEAGWQQHMDSALNASKQGDRSAHEQELQDALTEAQSFGKHDRRLALTLYLLGLLRASEERYADALPHLEQSVTIETAVLGESHPDTLKKAGSLAFAHLELAHAEEALRIVERILPLERNVFGETDPNTLSAQILLGEIYSTLARHQDAYTVLVDVLPKLESAFGQADGRTLHALTLLASVYTDLGRAETDADEVFGKGVAAGGKQYVEWVVAFGKRFAARRETVLGIGHRATLQSHRNVGFILYYLGRYEEALGFMEQVRQLRHMYLGPRDPDVAQSMADMAGIYEQFGRLDEAESLLKQSLEILQAANAPMGDRIVDVTARMAALAFSRSRYAEAEALYSRVLETAEFVIDQSSVTYGKILFGLARVYEWQGKFAEAMKLYKTVAEYARKVEATNPVHADLNVTLARLVKYAGEFELSEGLLMQALAINQRAFGADSAEVAWNRWELANLYSDEGRFGEADSLFKQALEVYVRVYGPEDTTVAGTLNSMGVSYHRQKRFLEAVDLYQRALPIFKKTYGDFDVGVATVSGNLADTYHEVGNIKEALKYARVTTEIVRRRSAAAQSSVSSGVQSETRSRKPQLETHLRLLYEVSQQHDEPDTKKRDFLNETFQVGQTALANDVGLSLAQVAARFQAVNGQLAQLARSRQDAVSRWQAMDKQLVEAISQPPDRQIPGKADNVRAEIRRTEGQLAETDKQLAADFPEYYEIANPQPLQLDDAQKLVGDKEALIAYLIGKNDSFLWAVRKDRAEFRRIEIGSKALDEIVKRLRGQLDPAGVEKLSDIRHLDVKAAHELYAKLFAPAEPLLDGIKHVMVVPDGALQSLPFAVLVTEKPDKAITDFGDYRNVPWLGRKYALTTPPSVSSLRALRRFAKGGAGGEPFTGFGDPLLDGDGNTNRGPTVALFSRGPVADVDEIRSLPRLPETADELNAIADALKADRKNVHLRDDATESKLKSLDLSPFRTLAFSTHGLMSGEFRGLAEPALVLTPPKEGTEQDDGLLTASEVAQLKLNADWVLLSACNTAAADGTPGAEGLSGLARAFFYAGSRALLVSHWAVNSEAAVALTTHMLSEYAAGVTRAEALQRSMLTLMQDEAHPYYAHPMFWAPFTVVGEGAR